MRTAFRVVLPLCTLVLGCILFTYTTSAFGQGVPTKASDVTVLQLNQQIKDKKNKISSLRQQIQAYQSQIKLRQSQKVNLENQISILEDQLSQTQLDIEATEDEIEQLGLEIQQANLEIEEKEEQIGLQKERIAELVRSLDRESERSYLELLLTEDRFSDFFDTLKDLEDVQSDLHKTVLEMKELREQLLVQKASLENNKTRQEGLKGSLVNTKVTMEEQRTNKQTLIVQSTLTVEKYQKLLTQARHEQESINSDIVGLEKFVREKLKLFGGNGKVGFMWPVDPTRGISAYFHDPAYPFRNVFEHPAIDVRAYQGSYIKAAEAGYVARVKYDGSKSYGYIMLVHDKGFATVYGHVSRPLITQDTYVQKGQVIALSGGSPGTAGSGPLTTGPHLHFEVRLNGIPVNPLNYLP